MHCQIREPIQFESVEKASEWLIGLSSNNEYKDKEQVEAMIKISDVALAVLMPLKEEVLDPGLSSCMSLFFGGDTAKCKKPISPVVACLENSQGCLRLGRALCHQLLAVYITAPLDRSRIRIGNTIICMEITGGVAGLVKTPEWTPGFLPQANNLN